MTSMKKRIAAALTAATLTIGLTVPAAAAEAPNEPIRVSSYKGSTLEVGERSGLIIGPSGIDYTVTSSDPDTVAVEQVLTFWVAVAKGAGTAEITASNSAGECGSMTLTVGSAAPAAPEAPASMDSASLTDNLEIRQEMIRLINQTRKANGVSELPVSEALMTAAQACSDRRYTWHHAAEEGQAAADAGYPYGFGDNLTVFTGTDDAARRAVDNWINSPGHFETMIDSRCDCIGVGVTQYDGITYCYMFVGIPKQRQFLCVSENKTKTAFQRKLEGRFLSKRRLTSYEKVPFSPNPPDRGSAGPGLRAGPAPRHSPRRHAGHHQDGRLHPQWGQV